MSFLSRLRWRYATKKFDISRKISQEDLDAILEAIRMTPTAFGLQPYHFYIVEDQTTKEHLRAASKDQEQLTTASHVIIFAVRTDLMQVQEEYLTLISGGDPQKRTLLMRFEDMLRHFIEGKSEMDILAWASRQVYIALGFALAAAAERGIDSCAMEGADFTKIGELLSLPHHEKALVMLPL